MEEINMTEEPKKRPTFLTVLVIITWVGCALAIIGSIVGYFTSQSSYAQMQEMGDIYGSGGMMDDMMESARIAAENAGLNAVIGSVCGILCLIGSIMMWNLKKMGFYIYTVGEIAPIITAFIFGGGGMIGTLGAVVGLVIAAAWVIMYALNLKHMK